MNINSIEQSYQRNCLGEKKTGENNCQSSFSASLEETAASAAKSSNSLKGNVHITGSGGGSFFSKFI